MPRKCSVYSSSDEETYDSSWQHYSVSRSCRKTRSPSSFRHITSRHSPSHSDTKWERHRSPILSWTRRNRHGSWSHSRSYPRKRRRHSRSHSMDFHTNKEQYRSRSRSKSKGSHSVLTSPHNASGHKGETSSTTEHHKYCSRLSSRYRKGTSNQRNNRSQSHSQTQSKRNESRSLSRSKERKRQRQRSRSNDSKDIYTHKVKEHYRSRSCSTDSKDIHTHKVKEHYRSRSRSTDSMDIHTKRITDREHHHVQKPEVVTVTCTLDFIHQILCRENIAQDHYPAHQYVQGKTGTNFQTLLHKNLLSPHILDRHTIHDGK